MNVFLGLPIPAEAIHTFKDLLVQAHPQWQDHSAIRWTPDNHHHLTLHFFGPIDPDSLSEWTANLSHYIQSIQSFSIRINKLYNFPKENSDLVAAYVHLDTALAQLYHQVQQAVQDYQFPTETRVYFPHITLCRAKRRRVLTMQPILLPDYPITISTLILYQTQSTPAGNQYIPLQQWQTKN